MVRIGVDQQQLQWSEKKSRRIACPVLSRPVAAELGAQLLQDRRSTWNRGTADLQPLKLGQQAATRQWRQPLQKLLDLVRQCHCDPVVRARSNLLSAVGLSRAG